MFALVLINVNLRTKPELLTFTHSKHITRTQNLHTDHVTFITPTQGFSVILRLAVDIAYWVQNLRTLYIATGMIGLQI